MRLYRCKLAFCRKALRATGHGLAVASVASDVELFLSGMAIHSSTTVFDPSGSSGSGTMVRIAAGLLSYPFPNESETGQAAQDRIENLQC